MPLFQFADSHGVGLAAPISPWLSYLAYGLAGAATLVVLSKTFIASPSTQTKGAPFPGPPASWFWQNPMPKQDVARELAALVEQHGPVVSFRRGKNVTLVIGRMDAAAEIMEKEGSALVDRPRMVSGAEILSGGMRLITHRSGDRFRRLRRAAHTHLQPQAARAYEWIQEEAAKEVIIDILNDPNHHIQHAQRYASAVILRITYGKTSPTTNDDPEVVRNHQVLANLFATVRAGPYLVDLIPWLKHVPGYGRHLRELHRQEIGLFRDQLNKVKVAMATNDAEPSFAKTLLENTDDHLLSNDEMAYLAGGLFGAGTDTTASAITVMIMAAACHLEAQERVQEELDEVVGKDRVPTFGDWDMLPHLQAFVLEAMRWRPVTPLGLAHRATRDIIWRNHCIPAGTAVVGCHWVISRDPVAFPDPETFNPKRWLTEDGRVRKDKHFYTYGFGRRVCPGQHVADRSLYINLAMLLWSFRILQRPEKPIDTYATSMEDVLVFHPKQFNVDYIPRVEEGRLREMMMN